MKTTMVVFVPPPSLQPDAYCRNPLGRHMEVWSIISFLCFHVLLLKSLIAVAYTEIPAIKLPNLLWECSLHSFLQASKHGSKDV